MTDTGLDEPKAQTLFSYLARYFGNEYGDFTHGRLPLESTMVSENLIKMPYYNNGSIYRGISVEPSIAEKYLQTWTPGTVHSFGRLQSFSSEEEVAENFSKWERGTYDGMVSIKFVTSKNRTAPGIQHLSHFGRSEAEVLSPETQKFKVLGSKKEISALGRTQITIFLQDEGIERRKKKK